LATGQQHANGIAHFGHESSSGIGEFLSGKIVPACEQEKTMGLNEKLIFQENGNSQCTPVSTWLRLGAIAKTT
jgi:hypothetical protein